MRSPWKLLAALEALALVAVFVLWPRGGDQAGDRSPESLLPGAESRESGGTLPADTGHAPPGGDADTILRSDIEASESIPADVGQGLAHVVIGRVTDWEGRTATDAGVTLTWPDGEYEQFRAGADGEYAIPGLAAGRYRATVWAEDCMPLETPLEVADSPGVQRQDFRLDRQQTIRIRMETSRGEELIDWLMEGDRGNYSLSRCVSVVATREPLSHLPPTSGYTHHSALANFRVKGIAVRDEIPGRYSGELRPRSALPLHGTVVFRDIALASFLIEEGAEELTVPVDESLIEGAYCELRLRVVDDTTGQPMAGVRVGANARFGFAEGVTDEEGRATLTRIPAGLTLVTAHAKDYWRFNRELLLQPGPPLDMGEIRLRRGTGIRIQGYLPDGTDAAGVPFYYYDPEETPHGPGSGEVVTFVLSGDGTFELGGVPVGRFAIACSGSDDLARKVWIVDVPPEGTELEVHLEAGTKVTVDTGTDYYDPYRFTLRSASGEPYGRRLRAGLHSLRLPPGAYRIDVTTTTGDPVTSEGFTVGAEPVRVELDLP